MKKYILALAFLLMSAGAQAMTYAELFVLQGANGVWAVPSGGLWRFNYDKATDQVTFFFDDQEGGAKRGEIYPHQGSFNLKMQTVHGEQIWTVKVNRVTGTLILTDHQGGQFPARYVRPMLEQDWNQIDKWRGHVDRGCGMSGQFC